MSLGVRSVAEFLGTALLVAIVVGSGIMAQALTTDVGLQLLLNMVSTVFGLGILIIVLLPVSGAQINPAVTLVLAVRRELSWPEAAAYVVAQLVGGIAGTSLAHVMFSRAALELSSNNRVALGTLVGEVVATAGLLLIILVLIDRDTTHLLPLTVPGWIGAAYIFTSSTSFANPAVTLGRMFTDSFSGIDPASVPGFIAAQLLGAALAMVLFLPITQQKVKKS